MAPTACTHPVSGYYFTPLTGVLFAFPSRYWFTIGQLRVFSLGGWSPLVTDKSATVQTGFHVSRPTRFHGSAVFAYGAVTHYGASFQTLPLTNGIYKRRNAGNTVLPVRLRAAPLSLIATQGISVDFFSSGYLDISVPRVRLAYLCIQYAITNYLVGFPHSEIPGSKSVTDSPRLIAGSHVLHRLQLPRHPPDALIHLTI